MGGYREGFPKLLIFALFFYISAEQGRGSPTPRFFAADSGGVATFENCVGAAA
jgi:hypothetical protein